MLYFIYNSICYNRILTHENVIVLPSKLYISKKLHLGTVKSLSDEFFIFCLVNKILNILNEQIRYIKNSCDTE